MWQISYLPVNGASQGNYFLAKMWFQPKLLNQYLTIKNSVVFIKNDCFWSKNVQKRCGFWGSVLGVSVSEAPGGQKQLVLKTVPQKLTLHKLFDIFTIPEKSALLFPMIYKSWNGEQYPVYLMLSIRNPQTVISSRCISFKSRVVVVLTLTNPVISKKLLF